MEVEQDQTPPQPDRPPAGGTPITLSQQRPRGRTACSQCSRRKIRCDAYDRLPLSLACTNCTKRGQPDQCTLNDDAPRSGSKRARRSDGGESSPSGPRPKKEPGFRTSSMPLLDGIPSASGAYTQPPPNGYPPELADPSNPYATKTYNLVPASQWPQGPAIPPAQYQPTYGGPPQQPPNLGYGAHAPELNDLLPAHKTALRYFDIYKANCHPIYPIIPDLEEFEAAVCQYVEDFGSGRLNYDLSGLRGRALAGRLSWLALLTAAIATGVQFSDLPAAERDSLTTRHIRNTMEILRQAEYLGRPDENCVGAMLLLSRITENDLMPEAAWTLLGTIGRMADLAGLQTGTFAPELDVRAREVIHLRYRKLWWSYLWQEAGLALCFGKPRVLQSTTDEPPVGSGATLTYNECMLLLCKGAMHAKSDMTVEKSNLKQEIDALADARHLHEKALPRLADRQNCRSVQDRIEYYALRIAQGSVVSSMSQTLIKASDRHGWEQQKKHLERMCKEGAMDCLQAFVDMQSFTVVPLRNWIFSYSAVSAALALSALADDGDRARIQSLQSRLLENFEERDKENDLPQRPGWFARFPKVMSLLRRLSQSNVQHNGAATQITDSSRTSAETDSGFIISDSLRRELLDPAALWQNYFSANSTGETYPLQQISLAT